MATTNSITSLLSQISDANLRGELSRAVEEALREKKFGLVFEEHLPEVQALTGVRIRKGSRVSIKDKPLNCTYRVVEIKTRGKTKWAELRRDSGLDGELDERERNVDDLIPVARYGEAIYPSLKTMDRLERAPDKPFHSIINADNYHALQLLLYGYKGAFDVIYIDPPYNTGARDWKYNNDYIDKNDRFRHSKWLSMMKKRLLLAKELLAKDGVLIITIDDVEAAHLRMLLDKMFDGRTIATVVIKYNPAGTARNGFSRQHEFAFFAMPEGFVIEEKPAPVDERVINLRRSGSGSSRQDRRSMFYPIFIDKKELKVIGAGEPPQDDFHPESQTVEREDYYEVWPIDNLGHEKRWYYGRAIVTQYRSERFLCKKQAKNNQWHIYHQTSNNASQKYKSIWLGENNEYDAGAYGGTLVKFILGREFPFPKSVYAVKDCLATIVKNKPDALILDFFAGSGTTLHATLLLNAEDDGNRRCVLVTNNEVSEAEEKALSAKGLKRGDEEWEKEGICRAVTIPRCKFAINGARDDGTPLPGKYLSGREMKDGFEANLQAFSLDFLDPLDVARGGRFEDIAPILWLLAGAKGDLISDKDIKDKKRAFIRPKNSEFLVSRDDRRFGEVLAAIRVLPPQERADLHHVFLVTNSREAWLEWRDALRELLPSVEVHQLYRDYLENYRLGENRMLTDESLVAGLDEDETA